MTASAANVISVLAFAHPSSACATIGLNRPRRAFGVLKIRLCGRSVRFSDTISGSFTGFPNQRLDLLARGFAPSDRLV
jgi:hypothetical protein